MVGHTWAIVLAGGEGTRIQPLIERCLGFACPKQYFTFCGRRSMLEHTIDRAVELVGEQRVITVTGSGHGRFLEIQRVEGLVMEQPFSRGTGAGVLLPAAYILRKDPEATVLIFPSDHFVSPKAGFLDQVVLARQFAERLEERMILMAAVPDRPETDYGWVQPGVPVPGLALHGPTKIHEVRSFREKPCASEARSCFERGDLWNTMIIAVKLKALWSLVKRIVPGVMEKFESFFRSLPGRREEARPVEETAVRCLYHSIPTFDFSATFLTRASADLAVMPLNGVLWSDWGRPERVFSTLRMIGRRPRLFETSRRWKLAQRAGA